MPETRIIDCVTEAAQALRQGLIVAFPTETVYGLGVDATNSDAVRRLFQAKGRPSDNPLIVHLGSQQHWPLAAARLSSSAELLLQTFSPGPITVVSEKAAPISTLVTAGLDTVGLRIPRHEQARQLLERCNLPIAAPSANLSGKPSCTTWESVIEDMDGRIDFVLRGDVCEVGLESTVVECTGEFPVILRPGSISLHQIQAVIPSARMYMADPKLSGTELASPGIRHAHYQPRAQVILFESTDELAVVTTDQRERAAVVVLVDANGCESSIDLLQGFSRARSFDSPTQYAREFYELLRQFDRQGMEAVYLHLVGNSDDCQALRDRQLRAAGRH